MTYSFLFFHYLLLSRNWYSTKLFKLFKQWIQTFFSFLMDGNQCIPKIKISIFFLLPVFIHYISETYFKWNIKRPMKLHIKYLKIVYAYLCKCIHLQHCNSPIINIYHFQNIYELWFIDIFLFEVYNIFW